MYGVVRFAEAAAELGVRTVFGAELSLGLTAPQNGVADPEGSHLLLLARDPDGYRGLCRTISTAQLAGQEKGRPVYDLEEVVADTAGHVLVLTGCRKGAVRQALDRGGRAAAAVALRGLAERFGPDNVAVELSYAALPTDVEVNDALAGLAADTGLPTVATTAAHYARPSGSRWPRRWRRFGPGAAWTRPTAGCRPRVPRTCARARRWPPGSTPAIPERWRGRRGSARSVRSRSISSPRTCPRSRPRPASRRRSGCVNSPAAESCSATAATTSTPKRSPPWSGSWRSSRTGSSPATS